MSTVTVVVLLAAVVRRGVRGMGVVVVGRLRGPEGEGGGGVGAVHGGTRDAHAAADGGPAAGEWSCGRGV